MVLFALAVIFVPMILDGSGQNKVTRVEMNMPSAPKLTFSDEMNKLEPAPAPKYTKSSKSTKPKVAKAAVAGNSVPEIISKKKSAALSGWVVQVGSFAEKAKAVSLQKKLIESSFDAFIEVGKKQNKRYYRVKAGPVLSKDKATRLQKNIVAKLTVEPGFIARHPSSNK